MAKPKDFAKRMQKHAATVKKETQKLQRRVTLKVQEVLVYATPADTSRALSNWQVSKGNPKRSYINPYFKGKGGSTQRQSARAALRSGREALSGDLPRSCFISNNAPYISRLNEGSSKQAPAGFVQEAQQIAQQIVYGVNLLKPTSDKE